MRVERGYDYEDTCTVSWETMPNYDEKIKSFFEEHIHSDEVRGGKRSGEGGVRGGDGKQQGMRGCKGHTPTTILNYSAPCFPFSHPFLPPLLPSHHYPSPHIGDPLLP